MNASITEKDHIVYLVQIFSVILGKSRKSEQNLEREITKSAARILSHISGQRDICLLVKQNLISQAGVHSHGTKIVVTLKGFTFRITLLAGSKIVREITHVARFARSNFFVNLLRYLVSLGRIWSLG